MMPIMNFIGNLGYVAVCDPGRLSGDQRHDHRRRHPGLHPVRALVHSADRADRQHLERAPADGGRGRARVRVPGRGRRSRRDRHPIQLESVQGQRRVRARALRLQPGQDHHQRLLRQRRARAEDRDCRSDRRRQDDDGQAADALLRRQQRRDPGRRARHPRIQPPRPAQDVRHGAAGYLAVQRQRSWRTSATAAWRRPTRR